MTMTIRPYAVQQRVGEPLRTTWFDTLTQHIVSTLATSYSSLPFSPGSLRFPQLTRAWACQLVEQIVRLLAANGRRKTMSEQEARGISRQV